MEPSDVDRRAKSNAALALWRTLLVLGPTAYCLTGCIVGKTLARTRAGSLAACARWTHYWFRTCARLIGMTVRYEGTLPARGTLIAPNHLGYCDIIAIGALLPTFYVAKTDVETWPVIGFLFRSSEHVGVPRGRSKGIAIAADRVAERLSEGSCVCIFLEGTSSGGEDVGKFHGALLTPAIAQGFRVVPASLNWRVATPGATVAEDVAYWKDHVFTKHVWRFFGLRGVEVTIRFGEPMTLPADTDRKTAAETVRDKVVALYRRDTEAA